MPRLFGTAARGTVPNDLLRLDYIETKAAATGDKYVLLLRNDHSNYCWILRSLTLPQKMLLALLLIGFLLLLFQTVSCPTDQHISRTKQSVSLQKVCELFIITCFRTRRGVMEL